jgi:hypothetical protein
VAPLMIILRNFMQELNMGGTKQKYNSSQNHETFKKVLRLKNLYGQIVPAT